MFNTEIALAFLLISVFKNCNQDSTNNKEKKCNHNTDRANGYVRDTSSVRLWHKQWTKNTSIRNCIYLMKQFN